MVIQKSYPAPQGAGFNAINGIVHAGFSGFRAFLARKKSQCKLIGNRLIIPHDTIPSNVMHNYIDRERILQ
jgi:hypothetical protein